MNAWVVHRPGGIGALQLEPAWAEPAASTGRILIEVRARGLNRSELFTRQGHSGDAVSFPRVLGIEAVGTVVDGGDTDVRVGRSVAAAMGQMGRAFDGGYGELTSVPGRCRQDRETPTSSPSPRRASRHVRSRLHR